MIALVVVFVNTCFSPDPEPAEFFDSSTGPLVVCTFTMSDALITVNCFLGLTADAFFELEDEFCCYGDAFGGSFCTPGYYYYLL